MEELIKREPTSGLKILPHWLAQPFFRAQPTSTGDVAKTEPKRVHGTGVDHPSKDRDESREEVAKRVKLMPALVAVPLPL